MEVGLGDFRSAMGFGFEGRGDFSGFSADRRKFCSGDGDSDSGLGTPLLSLLTLGVAGDVLLGVDGLALLGVAGVAALLGVSDKLDLDFEAMLVEKASTQVTTTTTKREKALPLLAKISKCQLQHR